MNKIILFSFLAITVFLAACTDATIIGGDLVGGSQLPVSYRDDIPVRMTTLEAENNGLATGIQDTEEGVAFGCIKSAFTGDLKSRVGIQLVERDIQVDLSAAVVDSIVLILPMDTLFQIGDTMGTASISVLGATAGSFANLEPETSTDLEDSGVVFGEITAVPPRFETTANVFAGDSVRVDTVGPELRIRMNQAFSDALLPALAASIARDTLVNDSLFMIDFPGIIIEGTDCGTTLPAIALSLSRINRMGTFVYYTDSEGVQRQYQLNYRRGSNSIGTLRPQYVHTFVGSPAAELLAGNTLDDTLALVQSLSGLMVKVDFPDLSALDDKKAVNAAFLDVPIVSGTEKIIKALPRILVRVRNSSMDLVDYSASGEDGTVPFTTAEGGEIVSIPDPRSTGTDSVLGYRFNITSFLQQVSRGERATPEFFLLPRFQTQLPGESILVGPGGDVNALRARLLLATTDLP